MRNSVLLAGAMALGLALGAPQASATTTYIYTGAAFDGFYQWSGANSVTGSVTLLSPLGANLILANVTPVSFSFTEGTFTVDDSNAVSLTRFVFSTDALGNITDWSNFYTLDRQHYIQSTGPRSQGDGVLSGGSQAYNATAGAWSSPSVPEPATWTMMLIGFGALGAMLRRRSTGLAA
jgi:hypothetical protein